MKSLKWKILGGFALLCMSLVLAAPVSYAKTYRIGPKSQPCASAYKKKPYYNGKTKNYYTIQSYLSKLSKKGGTLKLKKGTYKIPGTLYVPSNVTIRLEDGAKLKKSKATGTGKLKMTPYLFVIAPESVSRKKASVTGYKASKKVVIKGSGKATIDLGRQKGVTAVFAGHASGVTIRGISFKNRKGGNYIWIEGSQKITVAKCKFYEGVSVSGTDAKLGVRLETANATTSKCTEKWFRKDNTTNKQITIQGNTFYKQEYAIGSSKHVAAVKRRKTVTTYQTSIKILNNTFVDTERYAVYMIDWKKPAIKGNTLELKDAGVKTNCFVKGFAAYNPTIRDNTLNSCVYPVILDAAKNSGKGKKMPAASSYVTAGYAAKMEKNSSSSLSHYYVTNAGIRIAYLKNKNDRNFVINESTAPYHEKYEEVADFKKRKVYYTFTSYMEQLEYAGGGTITVEQGNYAVTNNICIPSNVTLILNNGVTFKKQGTTATDICYAKTLFTIVPPSLDGTKGTVKGYGGSHDVKIIGNGTVTIDCMNIKNVMALAMGGAKNIKISGITFANELGSHFIELNSSQNVTIEKCSFMGFRPIDIKSHKECINVDGNDLVTDGFNYDWSAHDKTNCKDIYIKNNTFYNIGTAVGSHTYSCKGTTQLYHENVQFLDNIVDGTYNAAVRALNWKNPVIKGNTFKNHQSLSDGYLNVEGVQTRYMAMLLRGVINPVVTENTFDTLRYYPIRVVLSYQTLFEPAVKAGYPATVSVISDENWAQMQNNTILNITEKKYKKIVVRENDDQTDSAAKKLAFAN